MGKVRVSPFVGIAFLLLTAAPAVATTTRGTAQAPEDFTGVLLLDGGAKTVPLTLHVDAFSTPREIKALARALGDDGQRAVVARLAETKARGWIRVGDVVGFEVPIIRSFTTDKGTRIFAVLDRPFPLWEQLHGTRSPDYPYGLLELKLNLDGNGQGSLEAAGRAMFTDDGDVVMLDYGAKPYTVIGVTAQPAKTSS